LYENRHAHVASIAMAHGAHLVGLDTVPTEDRDLLRACGGDSDRRHGHCRPSCNLFHSTFPFRNNLEDGFPHVAVVKLIAVDDRAPGAPKTALFALASRRVK